MGLSIAYHLAKSGVKNIVVVERSYLCGGASGRNGGGVRAQWSGEANIRLMQESIRICQEFATEMKINVWFRQGGYLFLTRSDARKESLEASVSLQQECGLRTELLTPKEAQRLVPQLDLRGAISGKPVLSASYNPDDGVVFPWPFVWGYAQAAAKLGVEIETHADVTGFETTRPSRPSLVGATSLEMGEMGVGAAPRIEAVITNKGRIATRQVVNAAGAWAPEVARLLGVALPNHPHRHEICSTEPLKPWLKPLVADLDSGLYFSQSMRGEIVGGISDEAAPSVIDHQSSSRFLGLYARAMTDVVPILGSVKVLRQWAGCYDLTPDANPIVGPVDEIEGFYQASGFMGHGFMMAPVMGKLIAQYLVERTPLPLFERWNLRRFKEGKLLSEGMIIG
ncbi:MAG: FAD-binding oxidoreductase [Polyangiales bacterium]